MQVSDVRRRLEAMLARGLEAVHAGQAVERVVDVRGGELSVAGRGVPPGSQLVVVALGKAAVAMAAAVEKRAGDRIRGGLVITKEGHGGSLGPGLPVREAAHPVPDRRGEAAARELLERVTTARRDDVLLVLLSGGASALVPCPPPGLTLEDLRATTDVLLACGADIGEMNTVRKHLSSLAGGQLALAAGCSRIEVIAVSDVPRDRLETIGSGPCEPDPSTFAQALAPRARRAALDRIPFAVRSHLERGRRGELRETPKPGAPELARVRSHVVARNRDAVRAVARATQAAGARPVMLGGVLRGEAREVGRRLAALARSVRCDGPTVLIAGGETVVTLSGSGRGGRSQELALAAAIELGGRSDAGESDAEVVLLASATDGSDGPTAASGACVDAGTVRRAAALGIDAERSLADNDSHTFFTREGGLLVTGPTETNVMDVVLIWVSPREAR